MIIDPVMLWKMAPIIMDLVGKYTGKEEAAAVFNSILSLSTLGDVFKDPKIAEVTNDSNSQDPSSFGEGLKIGKGISGIDYEKYNFDNMLGMKAFSKDLKNSDSIFDFNSNINQLGISGKNNFNEFPLINELWH